MELLGDDNPEREAADIEAADRLEQERYGET